MTLANRILLFAVALIAVIMLAVGYLVEGRLYQRLVDERITGLSREARLISAEFDKGTDPLVLAASASGALGAGVTLVTNDGVIVADVSPTGDVQAVGAAARRPEIAEALARDLGVRVGMSAPGEPERLFVAVGGERGVARVSISTAQLQSISSGHGPSLPASGSPRSQSLRCWHCCTHGMSRSP
jgi:hypothetical protein